MSTVFTAAAVVAAVEAIVAVAGGSWLALSDLQTRTEEYDGLGLAIGLFLLVPAVVVLAVLGAALVLQHRRATRAAGVLGALVGLPAGCLVLVVLQDPGGVAGLVVLGIAVTGLALAGSGLGLATDRVQPARS